MSGSLAQFGIVDEVNYGEAVVVTKFYEIIKEDMRGAYTRLQAKGLGSSLVDRADRFAPVPKGASGTVEFEVLTKGFGYWLKHMLGVVDTTGPLETDCYTHTAEIGNLTGISFTAQVGKPQNDGTIQPFTYRGGKVTAFELSNSVDELLVASLSIDAAAEHTTGAGAYVLATPSLPVGAEVFSWGGGLITIGAAEIDVDDISIKVDNALKTDSYVIRQGTGKREPRQNGKRKIEFSVKIPFAEMDHFNRIAATVPADTYAALVAKWEGPTLLGTTIYPSLQVTIPVARFDEGVPVVEGDAELEQVLTGVGLYDGTNSAIEVEYVSADVTP